MKNLLQKLFFFGFLFLFWSCQNENNRPISSSQLDLVSTEINPNLLKYLQIIGYEKDVHQHIKKNKDGYLIENDIFISHENIINTIDLIESSHSENKQLRFNLLITSQSGQYTTLYYKFSSALSSVVKNNIRQAFEEWNQIRNFRFNFEETSGSNHNVFIRQEGGTGAYAYAYLPIAVGNTVLLGTTMVIDTNSFYGLNNDQQILVAAHEIGHLIGLRHTDENQSSSHIRVPPLSVVKS